jgi:hypothetical protein
MMQHQPDAIFPGFERDARQNSNLQNNDLVNNYVPPAPQNILLDRDDLLFSGMILQRR